MLSQLRLVSVVETNKLVSPATTSIQKTLDWLRKTSLLLCNINMRSKQHRHNVEINLTPRKMRYTDHPDIQDYPTSHQDQIKIHQSGFKAYCCL